jgi:hypothetical protein
VNLMRKNNIDLPLRPDGFVEAIKVGRSGNISLNAGNVRLIHSAGSDRAGAPVAALQPSRASRMARGRRRRYPSWERW